MWGLWPAGRKVWWYNTYCHVGWKHKCVFSLTCEFSQKSDDVVFVKYCLIGPNWKIQEFCWFTYCTSVENIVFGGIILWWLSTIRSVLERCTRAHASFFDALDSCTPQNSILLCRPFWGCKCRVGLQIHHHYFYLQTHHPQRETAALKITSVASLVADLLADGFFGCGSSSWHNSQ